MSSTGESMPRCPRSFCFALLLFATTGFASAQTSVLRLITQLQSPDPALRDAAAQQLGKSGNQRAIQPLIAALPDTNVRVANDAATALGELHATEAIQPLIDSLTHSYCAGIVFGNANAPVALTAIGMPAVPAMMQTLTHTSYGVSGDSSFQIAKALDAIHSPEIVPPLAALLQSLSYQTRIYAEERLAAHPGQATVDAVLPMLKDPNEYVRSWAVNALGSNMNDSRVLPALQAVVEEPTPKSRTAPQIMAIRALAKQHDPALIPVLIDGLQYSDIGLDEASSALIALGPVVIEPLITALADDARPGEARYWAAVTLGEFDDPRVLPALLDASHDSRRRVREGVFVSKTVHTNPGFTNRLLAALVDDNYWRVRQLSGYALAGHDDPRVNPALVDALRDSDENVRAAAANSLAKRHDGKAVPALLDYLHGRTTLDHQQAAEALGTLGDAHAITPLIRLLGRRNSGDCYPISGALARLLKLHPDPEALDLLRKTLAQPDSSHCGPALALLAQDSGSIKLLTSHLSEDRLENGNTPAYEVLDAGKGRPAVEPAIAALSSPDAPTRAHAAGMLGANQRPGEVDPRAIEPLLHALDDPDQNVRDAAAISLINVDDPRKIEPFSRLLHSQQFELREYAAVGLGHVHDPRAVTALVSTLGDPDFNSHRGVMDALQHNTYPPVLPALLQALHSSNPVIRAGAAEALRYRTEPAVTHALIPLEHDPDTHVREATQQALSGCPVPPCLD
jgi:HEAT repeat protein